MRVSKPVVLLLSAAALVWVVSLFISNAHGQNTVGSPVAIVSLGMQRQLPTDSDGTPYLPVRTEDRQFTFDAEMWQKRGTDVMPLLLNGTVLPKQVTICGHRLSMIQGTMRANAVDESSYFAVTLNGSAQTMPNDGCFSITPVAYLRIKGIITIPPTQLTNAIVMARY